jgi:hypothetical protein
MNTISFGVEDFLKRSLIDDLSTTTLSMLDILMVLASAFALGLLIYLIYRITFSGVIFVKSFGTSLIMLTMGPRWY